MRGLRRAVPSAQMFSTRDYSAARIESRRTSHKNTLDFTLTEVEQKEAGG